MKNGSLKSEIQYHLMILPVMAFLLVFTMVPMFGYVIALEKYVPAKGIFGSEFVGLKYFRQMFLLPDSWTIFRNTIVIAIGKILCELIVPIVFALLLNEIRSIGYKTAIQTIVYLPHFLSWVVLAVPIMNIFSYNGITNHLIEALGGTRILFMTSNKWFRTILIGTHAWKEFGFAAIVFLAAITGINPNLYEAAVIDGTSRMQRIRHVTLPGMYAVIVLVATKSIGNVLSAGFDQIYNLYSPVVYETSDIIDTYVYRVGLLQMNYSLSTAVSLLKSLISLTLISLSNWLAYRFANYRIF